MVIDFPTPFPYIIIKTKTRRVGKNISVSLH